MKIAVPYLKIQGKSFAQYIDVWQNFEKKYNANLPSRERLKDVHKRVFYTLIRMCSEQLRLHNQLLEGSIFQAIENDKSVRVQTNRLEIKNRTFGADKTLRSISNYINRLTDAGVIKSKKFHGTQADFDLFINPDFLLIYDYNDEDYLPLSKFSTEKIEIQKQLIQQAKLKNLQVLFSDIPKTFNNSIITYGVSLSLNKEYLKTTENFPKTFSENKPKQKTERKEKEKNSAKKEKEIKKDPKILFITGLAGIFYAYMISRLFSKHVINPTHKAKAISYIAEQYFYQNQNRYTKKQLENLLEHYKKRLDMASEYVERKNYSMQWIFPMHYLSKENPKGFAKTEEWHLRSVKTTAKRNAQKVVNDKKLSNDEKLNKMIRVFANNPNHWQLDYCTAYVNKVLPPQHRHSFKTAVREMIKN